MHWTKQQKWKRLITLLSLDFFLLLLILLPSATCYYQIFAFFPPAHEEKTTLKMIINANSSHWHYRHTVQPCVCYYYLLLFLACTLYVSVSANLSQRLTFIRVCIGTSDQFHSFTHQLLLLGSFCSSCIFCCYFYLLRFSYSSVQHSVSIALCSSRTDSFGTPSLLTYYFPLTIALILSSHSIIHFLWYIISTFSTTTLQSKNWLLNRENYLPSANANLFFL